MSNTIPFRTRARTIDHLGREQIADCPTAVSELWKNAYDAYASTVALHIFDGEVPIAAVVDDGHGMSFKDFTDRWLVVGTEAKIEDSEVSDADRNGLNQRERQGQKGIGRLSVAALGPVTLVLSKRRCTPFVAALVDWRLFVNPYLNLEDIFLPVEQFSDQTQFASTLERMLDALVDNVWGSNGDKDRGARVEEAWNKYDDRFIKEEQKRREERGESEEPKPTPPSLSIANSALTATITSRHLSSWKAWSGEAEHGTALYVLGANYELAVWNKIFNADNDETALTREQLKTTLTGFVDPFVGQTSDSPFEYTVVNHHGDLETVVVSSALNFGLDNLRSLEHYIEGEFDESGTFRGHIRAFGKDIPAVEITPADAPPLTGAGYVGPFKFCIGTFEVDPKNSTHPPEQHNMFTEQAARFAGLAVYRNGLRVMPYGRPDADHFGLEERRSTHAGRWFWSHRRSFGRVAISRACNPNLRDKAGREGLIDNRARRELRVLVVNLLKHTALKYFGSDSELREQYLPEIQARNEAAKASEEKSRHRRTTNFREALRKQEAPLNDALLRVNAIVDAFKHVVETRAVERLSEIDSAVESMIAQKALLRLPPRPAKLGRLEESYRAYRDRYGEFCTVVDRLRLDWSAVAESFAIRDPEEAARSALGRHQKYLTDQLAAWETHATRLLNAERQRLDQQLTDDRTRYYSQASPLLPELRDGRLRLATVLNRLEAIREELQQEFAAKYESYLRALDQLSESIDIDAALVWNSEQRQALERRVEQLHSLAQLGITVEIIGHELDELDAEVGRNLRRLPKSVQEQDDFKRAMISYRSLMERLRFLSPMKLSGPRAKEEIRGSDIYTYLSRLLSPQIAAREVRFVATDCFKQIKLVEYSSRIFPVFTNLVNNALYWVSRVDDREVRLDFVDGAVVVADSGRGVDPDDLEHLFELFFTRRVEGRGVGLYLCRVNLETGGHTIEYATDDRHRVLQGANFVIHFRGIKHE